MSEFKESELYRINLIMQEFNFEGVHRCMVAMNWEWVFIGVPSIYELKKNAKDLLEKTVLMFLKKKVSGATCTGGFQAIYDEKDDVLELKFVVTEWDDSHLTENMVYKNILQKEKRLETIKKLLND